VAGLQQKIKSPFSFHIVNWCAGGLIFMSGRKYWLDYDLAALALLLIGLAAVEVLALVLI
jgi:hypothetical protein